MQFAKFGKGGKKGVNGAFVDTERKFTAVEALEFVESLFDFVAEVDETLGVISEKCAGIGQAHRASATNEERLTEDRKSTRLNSSHSQISYAVFCLKKKHV